MSRPPIPFRPAARSALSTTAAVSLLCAAAMWTTSESAAEEPLRNVLPSQLLPPQDGPERPSVLVLKTGQVITGPMEPQLGGYMVTVPNGKMLIQYETVRTAATSVQDAYQRMSANLTNPNANDRVELAHWCTTVGLWDEAQKEALASLQLEPQRLEARRMLIRIEAARKSDRPAMEPAESFATARTTNLAPGGLSRESTARFVRQVQPLLFNCCGNAACHGGAAGGEFRIDPFASGQRLNRLASDKNLAAVTEYIRGHDPDANPLLLAIQGDTPVHRAAFTGAQAHAQRKLLSDWVRTASHELGSDSRDQERTALAQPQRAPSDIVPASAEFKVSPGSASARGQVAGAAPHTPHAVPSSTPLEPRRLNHVDESFLKQMLLEAEPDPFDPEEFNRAVHGIEAK